MRYFVYEDNINGLIKELYRLHPDGSVESFYYDKWRWSTFSKDDLTKGDGFLFGVIVELTEEEAFLEMI